MFKPGDIIVRYRDLEISITKKARILKCKDDHYLIYCIDGLRKDKKYDIMSHIIDNEFILDQESIWKNELEEIINEKETKEN